MRAVSVMVERLRIFGALTVRLINTADGGTYVLLEADESGQADPLDETLAELDELRTYLLDADGRRGGRYQARMKAAALAAHPAGKAVEA